MKIKCMFVDHHMKGIKKKSKLVKVGTIFYYLPYKYHKRLEFKFIIQTQEQARERER